jgi:hypothetical protein
VTKVEKSKSAGTCFDCTHRDVCKLKDLVSKAIDQCCLMVQGFDSLCKVYGGLAKGCYAYKQGEDQ